VSSQRVSVESACIASIAFSIEENVLQLEFRNGLAYEYFGVPASLYSDLLSAQSKGAFVTRFIRGRFPFRRLGQPSDLT
jgi:KTSC domain